MSFICYNLEFILMKYRVSFYFVKSGKLNYLSSISISPTSWGFFVVFFVLFFYKKCPVSFWLFSTSRTSFKYTFVRCVWGRVWYILYSWFLIHKQTASCNLLTLTPLSAHLSRSKSLPLFFTASGFKICSGNETWLKTNHSPREALGCSPCCSA